MIDVRATPAWHVGLLPRAPGDPGTLKMQIIGTEFYLATPACLLSKETRREDERLIIVTCVGGVLDRESVLANIPVSQGDV